MPGLTIEIDFLTGKCVAASVSNRDVAEWPPHFGRVFMAMAAACFETGESESEVAALEWLEGLPAPMICASDAEERSAVAVYVPVNDKNTANKSLLQTVPGVTRSKQERSFPTSIPHDSVVRFHWPDAADAENHLAALNAICSNVIRVGHSSSLVRATAFLDSEPPTEGCWVPTRERSAMNSRIVGEGEFQRLRAVCNADRIEKFGALAIQIETGTTAEKKAAKAAFEESFGEKYKASLRPPEPTPPVLGLWQGYVRRGTDSDAAVVDGTYFDSQLIVLAKIDGPNLGIQDTLAVTRQLRNATLAHAVTQPKPPAWLSGHEPDGSPIEGPHMAFVALPYVGSAYADGHLMGMALALPKPEFVSPQERGRELGKLLLDDDGEPREIELKLGCLGEWVLRLEDADTPRRSLKNQTWASASKRWASVTPVVLDRFPKKNRTTQRDEWFEEVRATIETSCERAGLPRPIQIDIDTTPWHKGSVRAHAKTRKSRGRAGDDATSSVLGDGFPPMPSRPGKPVRPQIHVYLEFETPARGPVLLGAGRFLGYGLCRPIKTREN